jgi:hypothetical protein
VASVDPSSTSKNSIPGAALYTKLVRFSAAYRSTLKNGTITDNLITLSTISNGLDKPDDH